MRTATENDAQHGAEKSTNLHPPVAVGEGALSRDAIVGLRHGFRHGDPVARQGKRCARVAHLARLEPIARLPRDPGSCCDDGHPSSNGNEMLCPTEPGSTQRI